MIFKKYIRYCLLFLMTANPFFCKAADLQYFKPAGISGVLSEIEGVDCCLNGKEKKALFPVIILSSPVNFVPQNPSKPEIDEMIEVGVNVIQLALDDKLLKSFTILKGNRARVLCKPFHATNGHHIMPVLCNVESISK